MVIPRQRANRAVGPPLVLAVGLALVVYAAWEFSSIAVGHPLIEASTPLPFYGAAAVAAWLASRRSALDSRTRSAWRWITASAILLVAAYGCSVGYQAATGVVPFPSIVDVCFLSFYPLFFIGLLRFPTRPESRHERIRLGIDAALLALAGGAVVWYLVLGPTVTMAGPSLLIRIVSGAYPTGDLLQIFALARLLTRVPSGGIQLPLRFLCGALLAAIAGDTTFGWLQFHPNARGASVSSFSLVLGASLLLLAAASQPRVSRSPELVAGAGGTETAAARPGRVAWLPYLAPLAVLGLLVHSELHASVFSRLSLTIAAAVVMLLVVSRHVAVQRQLIAALRIKDEAEARYRTLVEQLPLITYIDSPSPSDEAVDYVSPQVETILGYKPDEWFSDPDFYGKHLHPDDFERVRSLQYAARETGEALEMEYRFLAKSGAYVWLSDSYTVVRDDEGVQRYTQGFALDVTARKQAELDREALLTEAQVQNAHLDESHRERTRLLARTVEVAEHERMRIAGQLHDGPIQKLTVVAFNLDRLARRIARNEQGVPQLVGAIRGDLQSEMNALRRLMSELRPPILDERNLSAALNDCAKRVFADGSIECQTICNLGGELPAPEVETAVYRVVREALINVSRHAGATRVQVSVERDGDTLRLLIADDGQGFESNPEAGERFGLLGMQERIGSVGGRLEVASAAGAGTRIEATLPWKSRVVVAAA